MSAANNSDDDANLSRIVWPPMLLVAAHFADTHPGIQAVERYLEELVFDDDEEPWAIEYVLLTGLGYAVPMADVPESRILEPAFLNAPEARSAIRRYLTQGMKHVRRFGFCVYAVLRGMDVVKWWRDYLETPPALRLDMGLPAVVLDLDEVLLRYRQRIDGVGQPLMRELAAELATEASRATRGGSAKYDIVVYNRGADLVSVPADVYVASMRQAASMRAPALERLAEVMDDRGIAGVVQPRTALYALAQEYDRLCRSERNHMNAEFARSTQHMIVQARPLQTTQPTPETSTTAQLYDDHTSVSAMVNFAQEQQLYTLSAASQVLEEHRRAMDAALGRGHGSTGPPPSTVDLDRIQYAHSHYTDRPVKLPEFIQLSHLSTPDVINDLTQMREQLAAGIAAAYAVPMEVVLRGASGRAGSGGGAPVRRERQLMGGLRTIETEADRVEHGLILRERALASSLFTHMYMRAIAPLDVAALDDLQSQLEERQAQVDPGDERLALVAVLPQHGNANNNSNNNTNNTKKRSRERATLGEVRDLVDELRTSLAARGSIARLSFKYSRSAENSARLSGLLELYDRGLIEYTQLQEPARALFGPEVKLRQPPEPIAPAAGGGGGAPGSKKPKTHR